MLLPHTPVSRTDTYCVNQTGCPNDPTGTLTYKYHKTGDCACQFEGSNLNMSIFTSFPTSEPGKYALKTGIRMYGTACAAWDQMPGTPWESSCTSDKNFCTKANNWCQAPWCYTSSNCAGAKPSDVFEGSTGV